MVAFSNLCSGTRKLINNKKIPTKILLKRQKIFFWELKSFAIGRVDAGKHCFSLLAFHGSRRSHYKDVPMATNTTSVSTVSAYHYAVVKDSLGKEDWQVHCIVSYPWVQASWSAIYILCNKDHFKWPPPRRAPDLLIKADSRQFDALVQTPVHVFWLNSA